MYYVWIILSLLLVNVQCADPPPVFQLVEECPNGTEIKQVQMWLKQRFPTSSESYFFELFNAKDAFEKLFTLDRLSGRLTTRDRIDRETLCRYEMTCLKSLQILVGRGSDQLIRLELKIEILDINDHTPTWQVDQGIILQILETPKDSSKGEYIPQEYPIPSAYDLDSQENSLISYRLDRQEASDYWPDYLFNVTSDSSDLKLVVLQPLDCEERDSYTLKLVATDQGRPAKSSYINLKIRVLDMNDETPQFAKETFYPDNGTVSESTKPGATIMRVSALDKDRTSPNNRVGYEIFSTGGPNDPIRGTFAIQDNGEIILTRKIDYENLPPISGLLDKVPKLTGKKFVFYVKATDKANAPFARSSTAMVVVPITDENDSKPEINIRFLGTEDVNPSGLIGETCSFSRKMRSSGRFACVHTPPVRHS
ncbi:hypothetical protein Ciccas_013442 [Cichlidogyrus casuarinus]|uniref:Cadherin domain-containing protein n=1 Tax=Cichlidogyrus casuarinus TaxID=1844966 RepID=A0ABD2PLC9_9PLAT